MVILKLYAHQRHDLTKKQNNHYITSSYLNNEENLTGIWPWGVDYYAMFFLSENKMYKFLMFTLKHR